MMIRREAFVESSQCSSGCQSGWTLYLDHSNGHHQHCCSSLPYMPAQRQMLQQMESDEEDSMVSDASSGPPTQPREEEKLQGHKLPQCHFGYHRYSSSGHRGTSGPSSGCFGSTRTDHSLDEAKSKKRRAAIQGEEAMRRHDDDLADTASSSAVFSCPMINEHAPIDVVEAMHGGGDLMDSPICALSARQFPEWPAMESTNMQQGYAMLHTVTD